MINNITQYHQKINDKDFFINLPSDACLSDCYKLALCYLDFVVEKIKEHNEFYAKKEEELKEE